MQVCRQVHTCHSIFIPQQIYSPHCGLMPANRSATDGTICSTYIVLQDYEQVENVLCKGTALERGIYLYSEITPHYRYVEDGGRNHDLSLFQTLFCLQGASVTSSKSFSETEGNGPLSPPRVMGCRRD
jgi:hypothetical protein